MYRDAASGEIEANLFCFNCHYAIEYWGYCPHEVQKVREYLNE